LKAGVGRKMALIWRGRFAGRAWPIIAVAGLAGIARAAHCVITRDVIWRTQLVGDASGYFKWAKAIADSAPTSAEPFYQAPLYPYVLAGVMRVFGESWTAIAGVQCVLGSAAAGLLCLVTWRLFGRAAGLLAGIMLALYAPAIHFDTIVQKTSVANFLVCALLSLMTSGCHQADGRGEVSGAPVSGVVTGAAAKPRRRAAVLVLLTGLTAGMACLTRENLLVWLPLLAIWAATANPESIGNGASAPARAGAGFGSRMDTGSRARGLAIYLAGLAVIFGPVVVRNHSVSGEWTLSTFQGGSNFYIGNHAGATGLYEPLVAGHETPEFERRDAVRLAEEGLGRPLSGKEVSGYWRGRAMEDIAADPIGWLRLMGRKALLVLNEYEVADAESQYVYAESSPVLRALGSVWHLGVLLPAAAMGIAVTWPRRGELWIYYALAGAAGLSVAVFYVMARYRFTLVPLLVPFAAVGVLEVFRVLFKRRGRLGGGVAKPNGVSGQRFVRLAGLAAVAGVSAIVANWPILDERRLDGMARMNLGVAYAQAGDVESAIPWFRQAVSGNPGSAEPNNNLAMGLALTGAFAEAIPHYRAALAAVPTLVGVNFNLGVALERVGRLDEAIVQYRRALELDPSDAQAKEAVERLSGFGKS